MSNWRQMNTEQRKQFKYDQKKARRKFERAARLSTKGVTHRKRRRKTSGPSQGRAYSGRVQLNRRQDRVAPYTEFQATDRRKRQIERGQLREANGLVR